MRSWMSLALTALLLTAISDADADNTEKEIRILFTNNSNGKLVDCNCKNDPYGGIAERVSLVASYREDFPDVVLLDSGGYFGLTGMDRKGPVILQLMGKMRYAACGIGDQELFDGLDTFLDSFGWFSDSIVNATLGDATGKRVFQPYRIIEAEGLKFGIVGLVSGDTFRYFPENRRDFTVIEPDTVLDNLLAELNKTCDYIIILSQMGIDGDKRLAAKWSDIDLIIGGHSQTLLEKPLLYGSTRIVQAGKNAGRVGEITLIFDDRNRLDTFSYHLIEMTEEYTIPPDIRQLVEDVMSGGHTD